ncbi:MAG: carboxypeptidase-like regulatory domain-containing protein, partial [Acidobacteriota bacterium]|nr:carboxypeptidase-like regulatory domain-containing protein [Acidobacteriota bacterium]
MRKCPGGSRVSILFSITFLFFGLSFSALAQSTATLQGTVTDPKGDVVPNAKVIVRNQATSVERTSETDSDGNFQVASLPA